MPRAEWTSSAVGMGAGGAVAYPQEGGALYADRQGRRQKGEASNVMPLQSGENWISGSEAMVLEAALQ